MDNPRAPSLPVPNVGPMPRFTVRPDDLATAGARLSDDAEALAGAAPAVRSAGAEAGASLGASGAAFRAALEDYAAVDELYAAALSEAVALLAQALVSAGVAYARADHTVAGGLGGGTGP